jgi:hypothetical protein
VSAIASGDVLTLTFRNGTPAFDVQTQPNTHFTMDPSGQPIDLSGSAGVLLHLRGFRGDVSNLAGDPSASSLGPVLLQVKKAGDFEGVVSIAAGLSAAGCANVSSSGAVLTIHFIQTPA